MTSIGLILIVLENRGIARKKNNVCPLEKKIIRYKNVFVYNVAGISRLPAFLPKSILNEAI
jgi:hypothetical protein